MPNHQIFQNFNTCTSSSNFLTYSPHSHLLESKNLKLVAARTLIIYWDIIILVKVVALKGDNVFNELIRGLTDQKGPIFIEGNLNLDAEHQWEIERSFVNSNAVISLFSQAEY